MVRVHQLIWNYQQNLWTVFVEYLNQEVTWGSDSLPANAAGEQYQGERREKQICHSDGGNHEERERELERITTSHS